MGISKKGMSALELQKSLSHKRFESIWSMMHKIRYNYSRIELAIKLKSSKAFLLFSCSIINRSQYGKLMCSIFRSKLTGDFLFNFHITYCSLGAIIIRRHIYVVEKDPYGILMFGQPIFKCL